MVVKTETSQNCLPSNEFQELTWIKWMGRKVIYLKDKLDPLSLLVSILAYCLFPLAAWRVVFTSSRCFKSKCDNDRLMHSRKTLQELGGKEISLTMPDGHMVAGMYFDSANCLKTLISKGAKRDTLPYAGNKIQEILWIPNGQQELKQLIERMGLATKMNAKGIYVPLGIPRESSQVPPPMNPSSPTPGTVIYAPGGGHLFEYRRKTLGTFLVSYGMNMIVLHYSGTGKSEGKISEQATYDNLEAAYRYLKDRKINDEKILGYGHCMGGAPIIDLGSKYLINILADRTFITMGEFAKLRTIIRLHLPRFLHFLTFWIEPVMNKCFQYDNRSKIKEVKGNLAVLGAKHDEMIPESYIQELFDRAIGAKTRQKLMIDASHDVDLAQDEQTRLFIGQFLEKSHLLGYGQQ